MNDITGLIFAGAALAIIAALAIHLRGINQRETLELSDDELAEAVKWDMDEGLSSSPYYVETARRAAMKARLEMHK